MLKRLRCICVVAFLATSALAFPQNSGYTQRNDQVYFCNELIEQADFSSFKLLGHSYAKDKNNVYYKGLRFVDPASFKLKGKKDEVMEESQDSGYY